MYGASEAVHCVVTLIGPFSLEFSFFFVFILKKLKHNHHTSQIKVSDRRSEFFGDF